MKTKKKLLILLSAIVLTATLIGCFALFSGAESVTPEMKITNCSLSFSDSVYIKYAVKTNVDDIKLLVWTEPQENYTIGTEKYTVTDHYSENIGGVSHEIFDLKELSAKMMTDNVYVRAYAKVGDTDYYSDPTKYSVLQYAYNKLGKTATASTSETLKTLLADMLTYGTSAQKHFNYKNTRLANADWYQVKLTAGTLDDGFTHGLYLEGDKVTLTAPETDADGKIFDGWYNSADTKVASTNIATITVGTKNEVYTPKYAATPSTPSYTVTFVDYDGEVLKTERVESGNNASAPASPSRDGYKFVGWDKAFTNVTSDLTVTATYELAVTCLTVRAEDVIVNVGDKTATITISVANNPGFTSLQFDVEYSDILTLSSVSFANSFTSIQGTLTDAFPTRGKENSQRLSIITWDDECGCINVNGTFATLTFNIADGTPSGTVANIKLTPVAGSVTDENLNDIAEDDMHFNDGTITVR